MGEGMKWVRISDYALRCDPWTICAITHGEGYSFELWHDKQPEAVGRFASPALAKAEAMKRELEQQA
jgi:hypothetical protein